MFTRAFDQGTVLPFSRPKSHPISSNLVPELFLILCAHGMIAFTKNGNNSTIFKCYAVLLQNRQAQKKRKFDNLF
jgi:hypothetical protein